MGGRKDETAELLCSRGSAWRRRAGRAAWRRGPRHGLAGGRGAACAKMQALPLQPCTPEPPPGRLQAPPLAPRPFCSITTPPGSLPCPLRVHSPPCHVLEQVGRGHRALSPGLGTRGSLKVGQTWRLRRPTARLPQPRQGQSPWPDSPRTSGAQSPWGSGPAFSDGGSLEAAQGTEGRLGGRRGGRTRPGSAALGRRVSRQRGTPQVE